MSESMLAYEAETEHAETEQSLIEEESEARRRFDAFQTVIQKEQQERNSPEQVLKLWRTEVLSNWESAYGELVHDYVVDNQDWFIEQLSSTLPNVADLAAIVLTDVVAHEREYNDGSHIEQFARRVAEELRKNSRQFIGLQSLYDSVIGMRLASLSKIRHLLSEYEDLKNDALFAQLSGIVLLSHPRPHEDHDLSASLEYCDIWDIELFLTSWLDRQEINNIAERTAERFGLELDMRLHRHHKKSEEEKHSLHVKHLRDWIWSVFQLEHHAKGATQVLQKAPFGIKNFHHFPIEVLIEMYDNRDNDVQYGVYVLPNYDWNDAITTAHHNNKMLSDFRNKLKALGISLRCIEVTSRRDFARLMFSLDKKYGDKYKMSFGILRAHGGEEMAQLGNKNGDTFSTKLLKKLKTESLLRFFQPTAPFLISACGVGEVGGLCEALAKKTGHVTSGTKGLACGLKSITPYLTSEGLVLDVIANKGKNDEEVVVATYVGV